MPSPLEGKRVILGVTGSIASYKALDLASKLVQRGALVDVLMSHGATQFVTPLAFRSLTHRPVVTDIFDPDSEFSVEHVALAQAADVLVIAPATAHVIAKLALGLADDALTTTALATQAPVLIAPAMDGYMYENPATQENLKKLQDRGVTIVGPEYGRLASGLSGPGRLVDTELLVGHTCALLGRNGDLAGRHLVVTAGGTQEPIDPIRVITNRSSGKMGYAIAEAARDRGATVTLVSAPTALPNPAAVQVIRVETALEMQNVVQKVTPNCDALIMAAAVADYRPTYFARQKIKKGPTTWNLEMTRTPDILEEAWGDFIKVGFAAETENLLENAREKLSHKGLHFIVVNDVTEEGSGFGSDTNKVMILDQEGRVEELPLMPKYDVAHKILDRLAQVLSLRS